MGSGSRLPLLLFPLLLAAPAAAQVPEYRLKAEFLERFTRFIEWPPGATPDDPRAPFVIGLYGGDPFGPYLDELAATRTIKGRRVRVREVADAAQAEGCQLLFIAAGGGRGLEELVARTESKPILTVGDTPGFAEKGILINFYVEEERIAFEINEAAARRSGLRFSSRLLKLARIVGLESRR
jgi:hypothetical protein